VALALDAACVLVAVRDHRAALGDRLRAMRQIVCRLLAVGFALRERVMVLVKDGSLHRRASGRHRPAR
jgi:hypothetical protein